MENQVISGEKAATQEETIKKKFGQSVTALRKKAGMTRADLAAKLGISAVTVGAYENGGREPSFEKMLAIADLFNVSLDELFGRDDEVLKQDLLKYRYDRARRTIFLLGNSISTSKSGGVAIIVHTPDADIKLNSTGTVLSQNEKDDDAIFFENQFALIEFVEILERRAIIENKPFRLIFNEVAEKLFESQPATDKGKSILEQHFSRPQDIKTFDGITIERQKF